MRQSKRPFLFKIAVLPALILGASVAANAQTTSTESSGAPKAVSAKNKSATSTPYRALRASKVIGMDVRNPKGEKVGEINDVIVDMDTGDVRYAILEFDGGIFQGEKLFAVPTDQLRMAADRDQLVYNMDRAKLEQAAVPKADWARRWSEPGYLEGLDKVWGVTQPSRGAKAHRASDLIGKDVKSRTGEKIGELEDLVINMAGRKVHYAVLEFDPSWAAPEKNFAFPLRAFDLAANGNDLVLDVDKARIQAMKSFPDSRLANLNDRVWVADVDRTFVTILPIAVLTPAQLFTRLDDDKNGWLSKTEVKDAADVDRNWTRFDKNGDGRVSRDEFVGHYTIEPGR